MRIVDLDKEGVSLLVGKVFTRVEAVDIDEIRFINDDGSYYMLYHQQDCCEGVEIEDMEGDLANLAGCPILRAEAATSYDVIGAPTDVDEKESHTWTFYKFATIKGYVDIRWFGTSNGYYSEEVNFGFVPRPGDHLSVCSLDNPPLKAGERVLCQSGHHVCDIVVDTAKAPPNRWHECFGNWQQTPPKPGFTPLPILCEQCGSIAIA